MKNKIIIILKFLDKHSSFIKTVIILILISRLCYVESNKLILIICLFSSLFSITNGINTDNMFCKNLNEEL